MQVATRMNSNDLRVSFGLDARLRADSNKFLPTSHSSPPPSPTFLPITASPHFLLLPLIFPPASPHFPPSSLLFLSLHPHFLSPLYPLPPLPNPSLHSTRFSYLPLSLSPYFLSPLC
ncbi:unnamed protein product [Closterium sp. Naga37s-1]|nr:unnamed protein product [Closterium sp. Naga37s-1]